MLPSRYGFSQPNNSVRKSRLDTKHSYLPKPRNTSSMDRLSADYHYQTVRSSSADPQRATFAVGGGGKANRESNSKIPVNRGSRSQQNGESSKFGSITPLQNSQYARPTPSWSKSQAMTPLRSTQNYRPTMTPNRTPSEDRQSRNWQAALERVLAFVTVKDQRPISNPNWQKSEYPRVRDLVAARYESLVLIRPLTIARFIAISGALITDILYDDVKLNNDTYVTKLPILAKQLLYPGTLSKSWLKTVNTLHAFPQALAFIGYLVDLVNRIEEPVSPEYIYADNDPLSCLRRDLIREGWLRFQTPDCQFDDLYEDYAKDLNSLLGNDEERILELTELVNKYESCLQDETEQSAKAEYERRLSKLNSLRSLLKMERSARVQSREEIARLTADRDHILVEITTADAEIQKACVENERVLKELEEQTMSVEERTRYLAEIDYTNKVIDSKRTLAEQLIKMLCDKEVELVRWQQAALDACVNYKHQLIHLSGHFPHLANCAVDEKELMSVSCQEQVSVAVEEIRRAVSLHLEGKASRERTRLLHRKENITITNEKRARINELKATISREQAAIDSKTAQDASRAEQWASEKHSLTLQIATLQTNMEEHLKVEEALKETQQKADESKHEMLLHRDNLEKLRNDAPKILEKAKKERVNEIQKEVKQWEDILDKYYQKLNKL